jgi:hypothetical protein
MMTKASNRDRDRSYRFTGDCHGGRIVMRRLRLAQGYGPAATEVQYRTYFDDDYKSVSKVQ